MDFLFWIGSGKFIKFLVSQELGYGQKLVKVIISSSVLYFGDSCGVICVYIDVDTLCV